MLKQQSSLEVLGAHLQTILASIMASLQSNLPAAAGGRPALQATTSSTALAGDAGSEEPLVKLVLRLTVQAPLGLHAYLRDVEPLLPLPALEPACRYLHFFSCFGRDLNLILVWFWVLPPPRWIQVLNMLFQRFSNAVTTVLHPLWRLSDPPW